jgi:hypothetical protein
MCGSTRTGRMVRSGGERVHAVPEARSPCMRSSGAASPETPANPQPETDDTRLLRAV